MMSIKVSLCGLVFLFLFSFAPLEAQNPPPITILDLESQGDIALAGDWLALSVSEIEAGEDLTGDGDLTAVVPLAWNLRTDGSWSPGVPGYPAAISETHLVARALESVEGGDFNGDGDSVDGVFHVQDLETGVTLNLELAGTYAVASAGRFILWVSESAQGEDLNGDGDSVDGAEDIGSTGGEAVAVFHVHDPSAGSTENLGYAGIYVALSGRRFVFAIPESAQGEDLTGDGDREDAVLRLHDLETGEGENLESIQSVTGLSEEWLIFLVAESDEGMDLNGDGDALDSVYHAFDIETGQTQNLELAGLDEVLVSGNRAVMRVIESMQGSDLNGDGDLEDRVIHVVDLETAEASNLELAAIPARLFESRLLVWIESELHILDLDTDESIPVGLEGGLGGTEGSLCLVLAGEAGSDADFNADGDLDDIVVQVLDLATVETLNTGLVARQAAGPSGGWVVIEVDENGADDNGDGDSVDRVLHVLDLDAAWALPEFLRGDCDGDGSVGEGMGDVVRYLEWAFGGGPQPACLSACDSNGDGKVGATVVDPVYQLNWAFRNGPPPPPPFPSCSRSLRPEDNALGCGAPSECR